MVSSYYYVFPLFLSGQFLRDDWMDLHEIFRHDLMYFEVNIFVVLFKSHFRSRNMAVLKRDFVRECSQKQL